MLATDWPAAAGSPLKRLLQVRDATIEAANEVTKGRPNPQAS